MAYIKRYRSFSVSRWHGLYPNKTGEFCGNNHVRYFQQAEDGTVLATLEPRQVGEPRRVWVQHNPPRFRAGAPSACPRGTSEEMTALGYYGFYLLADHAPFAGGDDVREVDTDELLEQVVTRQRAPVTPFMPDVPYKDNR